MFVSFSVRPDERGLLYRNGHLAEWLEPGRYRRWILCASLELRRHDPATLISAFSPDLARVAPGSATEEVLAVAPDRLGLMLRPGAPDRVLQPGRYLVWRVPGRLELRLVAPDALPPGAILSPAQLRTLPFERACIYQDGLLVDIVRPDGRSLPKAS